MQNYVIAVTMVIVCGGVVLMLENSKSDITTNADSCPLITWTLQCTFHILLFSSTIIMSVYDDYVIVIHMMIVCVCVCAVCGVLSE